MAGEKRFVLTPARQGGWHLRAEGSKKPLMKFTSRSEAERFVQELVRSQPGRIVVEVDEGRGRLAG